MLSLRNFSQIVALRRGVKPRLDFNDGGSVRIVFFTCAKRAGGRSGPQVSDMLIACRPSGPYPLEASDAATQHNPLGESLRRAYVGDIVNNRKEVIQCLIVYRRGRRQSGTGSSPLMRVAPRDVLRHGR